MTFIFILLYLLIGLMVAYFNTDDRQHKFDLNRETVITALTWPVVLYDTFK